MRRTLMKLGLLAALLVPSTALAADPPTLSVEPGVAIPLTGPQVDRFNVGGALTLKPLIGLTPYLDVGVAGSVISLPSKIDGVDAGTAWGIGPTLRLKRPHDESNTGRGFSAVSPWIDGNAQYIRTGPLDRLGLSLAVGAAVPTSDARTLWIGPFVRYTDLLQSVVDRPQFDNTDAHVLIAGVSFEFGASPVKKKVEPPPAPPPKPPVIEQPKDDPKPPPPDPDVTINVELSAVVPFKVDSAVILPETKETLAHVVEVVKKYADCQILVEGHASSEGPPEPYNQKLSEKRAQAVVDYLKAQGVPGDHLTAKGFSSTRPVADNATAAGRSANRRVEMTLTFVIVRKGDSK